MRSVRASLCVGLGMVCGSLLCALLANPVQAKPKGFYIERLPHGANVTIPRPATTFVSLDARIKLTSTDSHQSVSFRPINISGGPEMSVQIAIFDPASERVKYIDAKPGQPYLYAFQDLGSITIIPKLKNGMSGKKFKDLRIQIESNAPLEIAH